MTVTTMEVRSKNGEIRRVQWVGSGPGLNSGDRVENIGTATWQDGLSCNIAELSYRGGKIFPSLRTTRYTIWPSEVDIQVGDEILSVAQAPTALSDMLTPGEQPVTPDELMAKHAQIFELYKKGELELIDISDKLK